MIVALDETPPSLGDGFRVEAQIVVWQGDALLVPASAVFRDRDRWAIYMVDAGAARLAPVVIGRRGRTEVEILSGAAAGTTVVLHPDEKVAAGAKLSIRR